MRKCNNLNKYQNQTMDEWWRNNRQKRLISEHQQELSHRILRESDRVIDETRWTTEQHKNEVDYRLKERLNDIKFIKDEIQKQRDLACLEEEALKTFRQRTLTAIDYVKNKIMPIVHQCIAKRKDRIITDKIADEVDKELSKECKTTEGCYVMLMQLLDETNEQIRLLRAVIYRLDQNLHNKEIALQIDSASLVLKETQLDLKIYKTPEGLDSFNTTIKEWEDISHANIQTTAKELNSAKSIRSYVDILLKQVTDDILSQTSRTTEAFQRRIRETKSVKNRLEDVHKETSNQVNEMERNIIKLEKELAQKDGYIALCMMRLANRTQRPGPELCKDEVQDTLMKELKTLQQTVEKLNQMIVDAKATTRYLLNTQMQQAEEINVKTNSLKIDEVDCMTIRQGFAFRNF